MGSLRLKWREGRILINCIFSNRKAERLRATKGHVDWRSIGSRYRFQYIMTETHKIPTQRLLVLSLACEKYDLQDTALRLRCINAIL